MRYLHTFESYLESGRSPLYHFTSTYSLRKIMEEDVLKTGISIEDNINLDKKTKKRGEIERDKIKSISFTRLSSLSPFGSIRLRLDVDKLKTKYKIFKVDEIGARLSKRKSDTDIKKYNKYKKLDIHHNLPNLDTDAKGMWEVEFEERIYRNVNNVGKYITRIDMDINDFNHIKSELIDYIKKYPHIVIREIDKVERYVGKKKNTVPKEDSNSLKTLLDINVIKELEKEKELVS